MQGAHIANNAICDDTLFCNGEETCDVLLDCQAGTPPNCDDGVSCTIDSCNEVNDVCLAVPSNGLCDNGLFCDGVETCDPLLDCQAGSAPNCVDSVSCTIDSCNEGTDSCDNLVDNAACDDGLWCNGAESCDAALDCQAGSVPNCNDSVVCTTDSCNESTDSCDNLPVDAVCDDGLWCNGAESCIDCACVSAGSPCEDGQTCDEELGTCIDS